MGLGDAGMDRRGPAVAMLAMGVVALFWLASPAEARHNFSMLGVQPELSVPGGEVTVSGFSYTKTAVVRFGALDGPVLARLEPTANNDIRGTVRIPDDVKPGRYILFAQHEDANGRPTRFPGRAAIVVAGPGGPPQDLTTGLELEARPHGLVTNDEEVSTASLLAVALGTAGAAALVVGVATVVIRRRGSTRAVSQ